MFMGWAVMTLAAVIAISMLCGLEIDYGEWVELMAPAQPASLGTMFLAKKIGWQRIADAAECLIASLAITPAIIFATFLAMRINMPLADVLLSNADRMLGFDWVGLIRLLDQNRVLILMLGASYVSFSAQVFGIPLLLTLTGHANRARQMLFCFGAICLTACMVSVFFPAAGAFVAYMPDQLNNLDPGFVNQFLPSFEAVRSDPGFVLRPKNAEGIVTFPSVHAAVALLAIWGAWTLRWLRIPIVTLNVLMMLSTFTHGGHYLVDVLAGSVLAVIAILATSRLTVLLGLFDPGGRQHVPTWKDSAATPNSSR